MQLRANVSLIRSLASPSNVSLAFEDIFLCGLTDFIFRRSDFSQNATPAADLFISRDGVKSSAKMAVARLFVLPLFVLHLLYISNRLLKLHVNLSNVFYIQTNPSSTSAQPPQLG